MGKMKSNGIPHRDGWHLNTIIHSCFSLHPEDQGSQKYPINYPIKLSHCLSLVCFLYVHIVRPNYPYKIKKLKKTHIWINSKDKKLSSDDAGKDSPCLHCTFIFYFEFCFLGTSVLTNCDVMFFFDVHGTKLPYTRHSFFSHIIKYWLEMENLFEVQSLLYLLMEKLTLHTR